MNNKFLVDIYVPACNKHFDVFIPCDCKMFIIVKLVSGILSQLSSNSYSASNDTVLCDALTGSIYSNDKFVNELNIENGTSMILI